jgi:hypothetical protein
VLHPSSPALQALAAAAAATTAVLQGQDQVPVGGASPLVPSGLAALESDSAVYSHWAFDEPAGAATDEFCAAAYYARTRFCHYSNGTTALDFKEHKHFIEA